jgi:16S rRNA processing protein RimM
MAEARVAVGKIGKPHGVRGVLRLWPYDEASDTLLRVKEVFVGPEGGKVERLKLLDCREGPGARFFLAQFANVLTREQAELLVDRVVSVDASALSALEEGEFYHKDLLGLPGESPEGPLGVVEEILNNGGHDVLVFRDHAAQTEVSIPFVHGMVEVEAGRLWVTPPEGLIEATRAPMRPQPTPQGGQGGGHDRPKP